MTDLVSRSILSFVGIFLTFSGTLLGSHLSKREVAEKDPVPLRTLPQNVIDILNTNRDDKGLQNKKNKNLLWRSDAERILHNFYESVHLRAAKRNKYPVLLETQTGQMVLAMLGKPPPAPMPVYTKEKGWQDVYPRYRWQSQQHASKEYAVLINNISQMTKFTVNSDVPVQSSSLNKIAIKKVIPIDDDSDIEEIEAEDFVRAKTETSEKEDFEDSTDEELYLGNKEKLIKIPLPTASQSKAEDVDVIDIDEIEDMGQLQPSKQGRLNQIVDYYTKWQRKYRQESNLTYCSKQLFGINETLANIDIQLTRTDNPLSFIEAFFLNARKTELLRLQETTKQSEISAKERYQRLIQEDPIYSILKKLGFTDEEISTVRMQWGLGDIILPSL